MNTMPQYNLSLVVRVATFFTGVLILISTLTENGNGGAVKIGRIEKGASQTIIAYSQDTQSSASAQDPGSIPLPPKP